WSFAGGSANLLLARLIESELGGRCTVRNDAVTWVAEERDTSQTLAALLRRLADEGRPSAADALRFASVAAGRLRLSKFEPCLPQGLLDEYVAGMLDVEAARRAVEARRGT